MCRSDFEVRPHWKHVETGNLSRNRALSNNPEYVDVNWNAGTYTLLECQGLMGPNAVNSSSPHESSHSYCEIPGAATREECANTMREDSCSIIGFKDEWRCGFENSDHLHCGSLPVPEGFEDEGQWEDTWIRDKASGDEVNWCHWRVWGQKAATEGEASSQCPPSTTPFLFRSKLQRCMDNTVCALPDATEQECSQSSNFGFGYNHDAIRRWERDLESPMCLIYGYDLHGGEESYGTVDNIIDFMEACEAYNSSSIFLSAARFREGEYDTQEKCEVGVCDLNQWSHNRVSMTAEACGNITKCSDRHCLGCSTDYGMIKEAHGTEAHNIDVPWSACWTSNQTACSELDGFWEGDDVGACIVQENQHAEDCTCEDCVFSECNKMEAEQCGLDGEWMDTVSRHYLFCGVDPWSECRTEQECEEAGYCDGGLHNWFCYEGECGYRPYVCIAPVQTTSVFDDHGNCDTYMQVHDEQDWYFWDEGVQHTKDGCILLRADTPALCANWTGANWTSTTMTQAICLEEKVSTHTRTRTSRRRRGATVF